MVSRLDDQENHLRSILENLNTNPTISKSGTIQDSGYMIQDTRYRVQDKGYRIQDTEYRIQDTGYRIQNTEYRKHDTVHRI